MQMWIAETAQRLDAFLAEQVDGASRARMQKAIENGGVTVDGEVVPKPAYKLKPGQEVAFDPVSAEGEPDDTIEPVDLGLEILYEDDDCFVVNKPAGIAVHPGAGMAPGETTMLHGARFLCTQAELVHRLDKETTGCLLFAKSQAVLSALQKQFEDRTVEKQYLAMVAGVPANAKAIIEAPIGRNLTNRTKMSVLRTGTSREAKTGYEVLDATPDASLLRCDLHTGRTHQIRVHLESIGHPLLGDPTYSSPASEKLTKQYGIETMCLHAWRLKFSSPVTKKEIQVKAPVPAGFLGAMERVGLASPGQPDKVFAIDSLFLILLNLLTI